MQGRSVFDVLRDYRRLKKRESDLTEDQRSSLQAYARFLEKESHNLTALPQEFYPIALNQPQDSPVLTDTRKVVEAEPPNRWWFRNLHPPKTDPNPALIRTMTGHTGGINCLSLWENQDGDICYLSGSNDQTLRLWDHETGESRVLKGHRGFVSCLQVTPDGLHALSGSNDRTLRWWNLSTGQSIELTGHRSTVWFVRLSFDGTHAISRSERNCYRWWYLENQTWICLAELTIPPAMSEDGSHLLVCDNSGTACCSDLRTGKKIRTRIPFHLAQVVWLSSSGHSALLYNPDRSLYLWDLHTQDTTLLAKQMKNWNRLRVSSCGMYVVTGNVDGTVTIWNRHTDSMIQKEAHSQSVTCLAITQSGSHALSGSSGGSLSWLDLRSYETVRLNGHTSSVRGVCFTRNGQYALTGGSDGTLRWWCVRCPEPTHVLGHARKTNTVRLSRNADRAASGGEDGSLRLWNLNTRASSRVDFQNSELTCLQISDDGSRVLVGFYNGIIQELNSVTGAIRSYQAPVGLSRLFVDWKNERFVSGTQHSLRSWDLNSGDYFDLQDTGSPYGIPWFALDPSCAFALSGDWDVPLILWNVQTSEKTWLEDQSRRQECLLLRSDGAYALSRGVYHQGNLNCLEWWNLQTGHSLFLMGHTSSTLCLELSSDFRYLLTGSHDRTLKWWDLQTGVPISLHGHTDSVTCLGLTSDNKFAISGSSDNSLRWWDLSNGDCLSMFSLEYPVTCLDLSINPPWIIAAGDSGGFVHFFRIEPPRGYRHFGEEGRHHER